MESEETGETPKICLYVAGDAPSSRAARQVLAELTGSGDGVSMHCEIVDVLRDPARALEVSLLATPTLIVEDCCCSRRFVGELRGHSELRNLIAAYRQQSATA